LKAEASDRLKAEVSGRLESRSVRQIGIWNE